MTKEEAIKQLKDLLIDSKKFVSIEPTKEDVQAMEIIVGELEKPEKDDFEKMCTPIIGYLKANYTPYSMVIISCNQIRITEDILGIPIRSND